jgi:hypothetical protein
MLMKWFKRLTLLFVFVALIALNVATLVSGVVFNTLSGLVERVTTIDTPHRQIQQRALRQKAVAQQVKRKGLHRAKRLVAYQALEATSSYLPLLGTAVVIGGTAWELKQLCDSLNDMNDLQAVFELEPEEDEAGILESACNPSLPEVDVDWDSVVAEIKRLAGDTAGVRSEEPGGVTSLR